MATSLPWPIIARSSRVAFPQSPEDDVETGGDGPVPDSGGVLVAPAGPGRPCALLRPPKANRRPRRRRPLQSQPGSVQLFASPEKDGTLTRVTRAVNWGVDECAGKQGPGEQVPLHYCFRCAEAGSPEPSSPAWPR